MNRGYEQEVMKPYYQDDYVTIYCGDNRDVVPQLNTHFDLLLTDPPYGIGFAAKHTKWSGNRGTILGDWDDKIPDIEWFLDKADSLCIWGGERFALPVSRGWLAWIKPDAPKSFASFELAWTNKNRPAKWIEHSISATNRERLGHPSQKPLRVMSWCISEVAPDAKTILDPFAGTCTTGRAAKDMGIKCVMIERDERYCEMGAKRMAQEVFPFVCDVR